MCKAQTKWTKDKPKKKKSIDNNYSTNIDNFGDNRNKKIK